VPAATLAHVKPFLRFVATACGVSWAIWTPVFARRGRGLVAALAGVIGTAGPAIAAGIEARRGASTTTSEFAGRCRRAPTSPFWWAVAPGVPIATTLGGATLAAHRIDRTPTGPGVTPAHIAGTAAVALTIALPDGPLGEEPGWRGYAVPVLQREHSPLTGSLLVGMAWTAWHIPLLAAMPSLRFGIPLRAYIGPYAVWLIAQSVFHTWMHNASGGGVPVAVLAHSGVNATFLVAIMEGLPEVLEPDHAPRTMWTIAGAWAVVALAIAGGTRGRLALAPRTEPARTATGATATW
jgi:uncharacterized protein